MRSPESRLRWRERRLYQSEFQVVLEYSGCGILADPVDRLPRRQLVSRDAHDVAANTENRLTDNRDMKMTQKRDPRLPTKSDPQPQGWQQCPEGRFVSLSRQLQGKRTRREVFRVGGALAALLVGGTGLYFAGKQIREYVAPGGIYCSQVPDLVAKAQGQTISVTELARLQKHLRNCSKCKPFSDKLNRLPSSPCCG